MEIYNVTKENYIIILTVSTKLNVKVIFSILNKVGIQAKN